MARLRGMKAKERIRSTIKAGRRRGALWVRILDFARLAATGEGRGALWTRYAHRREVHQTTPYTHADRYPRLFDLAASLAPNARRILSFGCSTGEELLALRERFPGPEIVGAEINPRSRWIARRRVAHDARIVVVHPRCIDGIFDCVFALAVLQRQPHKVAEIGLENLSDHYPFSRFDSAVTGLVARLRSGGLLCVINAQYRVEDSSAAKQLEAVEGSPPTENQLFGPDGRLLKSGDAATIFRKRG